MLVENGKKKPYLQTLTLLGVNSIRSIKVGLRNFAKSCPFSAAC
jgi:hypothetical protein